jgi:hypothetical protein
MTAVVIGTQAEASHGNTKGVATMFPESEADLARPV